MRGRTQEAASVEPVLTGIERIRMSCPRYFFWLSFLEVGKNIGSVYLPSPPVAEFDIDFDAPSLHNTCGSH